MACAPCQTAAMDKRSRYADVNGIRMYHETVGDGPPPLVLHGGTCTIDLPGMEIPFFASEFEVIAPEQVGHGRTEDRPDRDLHYHDMAEDTVELLSQLDVGPVSVFGFSDGGIIGLDLAIHHPELVTKLVLTGTNFRTDGLGPGTGEWLATVKPEEWPESFRLEYARLSPDGADHWPVVPERLKRMWASEPNYTDEEMAGIGAPTLVIAGDRDAITPEHAVATYRLIPDSQLCIVPHAGHGAMAREQVLAFLNEPAAVVA